MNNIVEKIKELANKAKERVKNFTAADIMKTASGILGLVGAIAVIRMGAESTIDIPEPETEPTDES